MTLTTQHWVGNGILGCRRFGSVYFHVLSMLHRTNTNVVTIKIDFVESDSHKKNSDTLTWDVSSQHWYQGQPWIWPCLPVHACKHCWLPPTGTPKLKDLLVSWLSRSLALSPLPPLPSPHSSPLADTATFTAYYHHSHRYNHHKQHLPRAWPWRCWECWTWGCPPSPILVQKIAVRMLDAYALSWFDLP